MSYVIQLGSHTCTRGSISVHLSMCSAFWGRLVLGRNGALVSKSILSLVAEKSQDMASKEEKPREYHEQKLRPERWDSERENYNDWRFLVDV